MSSQQPAATDYEHLKALFELYPYITLLKTEGDPPDSYEIEYTLRGYAKNSEDAVLIEEQHRVRISLPFGYPHFAPIAKPLTNIFHPDIDPAAIRIADRWQENPSLPDLILYIGEMICGKVYTLDDPFNPEAAEWYKEHQDQLPLDSLDLVDIEEQNREEPIDVESVLLELEDDTIQDADNASGQEGNRIDRLMAAKKLFAANALLKELPEDEPLDNREELQKEIAKGLRKAAQMLHLAEQLENMGKFAEAMEMINNIQAIASDAPGLEELHTRLRESFRLSQPSGATSQQAEQASTLKESAIKKPIQLPKLSLDTFLQNVRRFRLLGVFILFVAFGGWTASLYFNDQAILDEVEKYQKQGRQFIANKDFEAGIEVLNKAKEALNQLTLLRFYKSKQEKAIDAIIHPTQDITKTTDTRQHLAKMAEQAKALAEKDGNQIKAMDMYRRAVEYADSHGLKEEQLELEKDLHALEAENFLNLAGKAEQKKKWDEAMSFYRMALNLFPENADERPGITQKLHAATFRQTLDQARKAFAQSEWLKTISLLEQAQNIMQENPGMAQDQEQQELRGLLANARLYLTLANAKNAVEKMDWPLAIKEYENALRLLRNDSSSLGERESVDKIEKTLLLVRITEQQNLILNAEKKNDLKGILQRNQEIKRLIKESRFINDPEIKNISQTIEKKVASLQEQLTLKRQITWLKEHYEEIFRKNYATLQGSELLQPEAVLLKRVGNNPVFTLTCLEKSMGRSSKLELAYMYDTAQKKWVVYSDY